MLEQFGEHWLQLSGQWIFLKLFSLLSYEMVTRLIIKGFLNVLENVHVLIIIKHHTGLIWSYKEPICFQTAYHAMQSLITFHWLY